MAEFLHTFRGGKMNKDVDERLIPEGQYRDALNLEISTSEGSDTGALQNIKGNTEIINKVYNANTNSKSPSFNIYFCLFINDIFFNCIYYFVIPLLHN